jgi:hypothetical protein
MVGEDGEVACFQHMTEMLRSLIYSQRISIVGALFLPNQASFLGKNVRGCQALSTRHCNMAPWQKWSRLG